MLMGNGEGMRVSEEEVLMAIGEYGGG